MRHRWLLLRDGRREVVVRTHLDYRGGSRDSGERRRCAVVHPASSGVIVNFEGCDVVLLGTSREEERVGKEDDAINIEDGSSRCHVCDADFVLEREG